MDNMGITFNLDQLHKRLMPSLNSQLSSRDDQTHCSSKLRRASVLISFLQPDSKTPSSSIELLFVKRATGLPQHSGEVAFPGGTMKSDIDSTFFATALREAQEEVGITPNQVHPWGYLRPIKSISQFCIIPVLAELSPPFQFHPDCHEIVDVFTVPLAHFLIPKNHRIIDRFISGDHYQLHSFMYQGNTIWGVTGALVYRILTYIYPKLFPNDPDPYHAEQQIA